MTTLGYVLCHPRVIAAAAGVPFGRTSDASNTLPHKIATLLTRGRRKTFANLRATVAAAGAGMMAR
jgi:hypothetical protein